MHKTKHLFISIIIVPFFIMGFFTIPTKILADDSISFWIEQQRQQALSLDEQPLQAPICDMSLFVDDGSLDSYWNFFSTNPSDWIILNRFTPEHDEFPLAINEVHVYIVAGSDTSVGDNITIVIYENTSGNENPSIGSKFLYSYPVTIKALNAWNSFVLPEPVKMNDPGDVIVGVIFRSSPFSFKAFGAFDTTVSKHRSWIGWWENAVAPNPPILQSLSQFLLIDDYFAGNWMIRACYYSIDQNADEFKFPIKRGVPLSSYVTSNTVTVSGINEEVPISVKGGEYSINGGPYTSADGTVNNGDTVQIRLISAASYSTLKSAIVNIGGESDNFVTETEHAPAFSSGDDGGYCFIATAAFGSPLAGQVEILRQFRDRYLLTNSLGKKFVSWYYNNGPVAANFIKDKPLAKVAVQMALYPLIGFSLLLMSGYLPLVTLGLLLCTLLLLRFRPKELNTY